MLMYDTQKIEESVAVTAALLYCPMYILQTTVGQPRICMSRRQRQPRYLHNPLMRLEQLRRVFNM
jgi:hypothetical protein